jgi:hypothetical protein
MANGLTLPIKATIADAKESAFDIENTGGNVAVAASTSGTIPFSLLQNAVAIQGKCAPQSTVEQTAAAAITIAVQGINSASVNVVPSPLPFPAPFVLAAIGVQGVSNSAGQGSPLLAVSTIGVQGIADGTGVHGVSDGGLGVSGDSTSGVGVRGTGATGVLGTSVNGSGVEGRSTNSSGLLGTSTGGAGVFGKGTPAGHFEGNVEVTGQLKAASMEIGAFGAIIDGALSAGSINCDGDLVAFGDIRIQSGKDVILADCAEEFDARQDAVIESGTVMVIDRDGMVEPSRQAYDKRVAGVVSGAGNCKPAIVLDQRQSHGRRVPLALVGKVYCKVDAQYASIEIGDLLTTSPTSGHAMKASDAVKAFGAVIGKALRSIESGQGMIPILVALQ